MIFKVYVHLALICVARRLSACLAPDFYLSAGMYLTQGHKALRCYLNTPSKGALRLKCPLLGMYGSADGAAQPGPDQRVLRCFAWSVLPASQWWDSISSHLSS